MATRTITLKLDAYEHLQRAKRGRESFSSVVRRVRFDPEEATGAAILGEMTAIYCAGKGVDAKTLGYWDADASAPRISPSKWGSVRAVGKSEQDVESAGRVLSGQRRSQGYSVKT